MTTVANIPGMESIDEAPRVVLTQPTSDEARLTRRAQLKRRRAEAKLAEARMQELDRAIAEVDDALESLAAQHVADCAPIQAGLSELESKRLDLLVGGGDPFTAELTEKRQRLQDELNTRNTALTKATDDKKSLRTSLEKERYDAAVKSADGHFINQELLFLALPELAIAATVARSTLHWASVRAKAAQSCIVGQTNWRGNNPTVAAEIAVAEELLRVAQEACAEANRVAIETD